METTSKLVQALLCCAKERSCRKCPMKDSSTNCWASLARESAYKLEQLTRLIDDMLDDHYVDYLDFYANRCRELEGKLGEVYDGNN